MKCVQCLLRNVLDRYTKTLLYRVTGRVPISLESVSVTITTMFIVEAIGNFHNIVTISIVTITLAKVTIVTKRSASIVT